MKNAKVLFVCIICLACLTVSGLSAQPLTLAPQQDVYVDQQNPGINFNEGELVLSVQNAGPAVFHKNICLRFDVPAGISSINAASLMFPYDSTGSGGVFDLVHVYTLTGAWDENTLTWNDQQALLGTLVTTLSSVGGFLNFSLPTALVADWSANPASNFGLVVVAESSFGWQWSQYADKEDVLYNCVTLSINGMYNGPPPQPIIAGNDTLCSYGGEFMAYPFNFYNYTWTYPSSWSAFPMLNSLSVSSALVSGQVCLYATNSYGSSPTVCRDIVVSFPGQSPGSVTGPSQACSGDTLTYTLSPVIISPTYSWSLPASWTLLSGGGSTQVTVVVGAPGNAFVDVSLPGPCISQPAYISVSVPTPPSVTYLSGPQWVVPGTVVTYSASSPYATSYLFTLPPGATIVSGAGTASPDILFGWQAGQVCASGTNLCGVSPPQCITVGLVGVGDVVPEGGIQIQRLASPHNDMYQIDNKGNEPGVAGLYSTVGGLVIPLMNLKPGEQTRFRIPSKGLYLLHWKTDRSEKTVKLVE